MVSSDLTKEQMDALVAEMTEHCPTEAAEMPAPSLRTSAEMIAGRVSDLLGLLGLHWEEPDRPQWALQDNGLVDTISRARVLLDDTAYQLARVQEFMCNLRGIIGA